MNGFSSISNWEHVRSISGVVSSQVQTNCEEFSSSAFGEKRSRGPTGIDKMCWKKRQNTRERIDPNAKQRVDYRLTRSICGVLTFLIELFSIVSEELAIKFTKLELNSFRNGFVGGEWSPDESDESFFFEFFLNDNVVESAEEIRCDWRVFLVDGDDENVLVRKFGVSTDEICSFRVVVLRLNRKHRQIIFFVKFSSTSVSSFFFFFFNCLSGKLLIIKVLILILLLLAWGQVQPTWITTFNVFQANDQNVYIQKTAAGENNKMQQ